MFNTLSSTSLIVVEFFIPIKGSRLWYFGSLAAIYEMFTPEEVGCKLASLWNASLQGGDKKITRRCVIYKQVMYRKSHKKGRA